MMIALISILLIHMILVLVSLVVREGNRVFGHAQRSGSYSVFAQAAA